MNLRLRILLPVIAALMCIGAASMCSVHLVTSWHLVEQTEVTRQLHQERSLSAAQEAVRFQFLVWPNETASTEQLLALNESFLQQEQLASTQIIALRTQDDAQLAGLLDDAIREHKRLGEAYRSARSGGPDTTTLPAVLRRLEQRSIEVHTQNMAKLRSEHSRNGWLLLLAAVGVLIVVANMLLVGLTLAVARPIEDALAIARKIVIDLGSDAATDLEPTADLDELMASMHSIHSGVHDQRQRLEFELTESFSTPKGIAQSAQDRVEFLSAITHELRTPLHGVLGSLQLLQNMGLNEEQRRLTKVAEVSGQRLLGLINDVGDISDASSGSLVVDTEPLDIGSLIAEVVDHANPESHAKGLKLATALRGLDDVTVLGDAERLRQIVENLVDNAIQFTDAGFVELRATGTQGDGHLHLKVEVEDTGVGIAEHRLDNIFDCLTTSDGTLSRSGTGTGLGLALCRELVAVMQGDLYAQSQVGVGSTFAFEVTLPIEHSIASQPRILVVEDLPVNQAVLIHLLRTMGHRADVASNGYSAMEILQRGGFDLVLLDVDLPGMDGLELCQWIATAGLQPEPRVVAVTASARPGDREACIAAGMHDYMAKPVRHDELRAMLMRWLPTETRIAS